MTEFTCWGVDWALNTGLAIAWRGVDDDICTLRLRAPGGTGAERLAALHKTTIGAAGIVALNGPPTAVYVEQAVGQPNPRLLEAQGVVLSAFWAALDGQTEYPPNVWLLKATEWRQKLAMISPREGKKPERRAARKLQQRNYALSIGAPKGLSEDEYDAVCVMHAGELDLGGQERQAA